jgi:eukaryotic-like serine/threonine-protein kinase
MVTDRHPGDDIDVLVGVDDRNEVAGDLGVNPMPTALDSIDDAFLRGRLHASLFGSADAGVWIDRFELLAKLGAGGMGSVWAARDHRLGRRVALKFLRSHLDGSVGEQRLFREAQALARIADPNVVNVFDVGRHEGRVWIAMEHVPGQTLREWARARPRSRRQILERWMAAGEGLAAIHAAGLIHRDVKPDNLMLGDDGRVRVIDFGLVRALELDLEPAAALAEATLEQTAISNDANSQKTQSRSPLAGTHGFVGTPAYAAPEQHAGEAVDARADQYSFCVSLYEALTGERPDDMRRLGASPLPSRIQRALQRGLERAPERRFADMRALLDALAPRRGRWIGAGMVAALALGLGGGLAMRAEPVTADPCSTAGAAVDELWTAEQRRQLARALPGPAGAEVVAALDELADRLRRESLHSCQ